ncbi:MAG: VanZ family protein [Candidatus Aenigmatarchaeota archaeon]
MKKGYYRLATVFWVIVIIVLATIKQVPGGIEIPFLDKITHFFEFFVLSILLFKTFSVGEKIGNKACKTIVFGIFYSIIIETYQLFISWRHFSVYDIAINLLGTFLGVYILTNVTKYFSGRRPILGENYNKS